MATPQEKCPVSINSFLLAAGDLNTWFLFFSSVVYSRMRHGEWFGDEAPGRIEAWCRYSAEFKEEEALRCGRHLSFEEIAAASV